MSPPSITANLDRLRNQIADACARAHRDPSTVALMAVSKTHPADAILEAHAAGQCLFGENRVQEFAAKQPLLNSLPDLDVHLIGPLQNNKTTPAAQLFHAIDAVDSIKTATRLHTAAQALSKTLPILIEIKLSHEDSKHGLDPSGLPALLTALAPLTSLRASGLMTVPPLDPDPSSARRCFRQLRQLRDENVPTCPSLTQLSMGMSNDFLIAIEEGSTCVRLGTAIFGHREYPTA